MSKALPTEDWGLDEQEYWLTIVAEVETAERKVRHARLLNHQAAYLLKWARVGLALSSQPNPGGKGR